MMLGLPISWRHAKMPWGYKISDYDPDILEPIEEDLIMLLEAKKYLRVSSYQKVADWMSVKTGRTCTIETLRFMMEFRHPIDELRLPRDERELLANSSR